MFKRFKYFILLISNEKNVVLMAKVPKYIRSEISQEVSRQVRPVRKDISGLRDELNRRLFSQGTPIQLIVSPGVQLTVPQTIQTAGPQVVAQTAAPQRQTMTDQEKMLVLTRYGLSIDDFTQNDFEYNKRLNVFADELRRAYTNDQLAELIAFARGKIDPRGYVAVLSAYLTDPNTGDGIERGNSLPKKLEERELFAVNGDIWYFGGLTHPPNLPDSLNVDYLNNLGRQLGFL